MAHVMGPWISEWQEALDDVVMETRPYDFRTRGAYIQWYAPRTRVRVRYTPAEYVAQEPSVEELYPEHQQQRQNVAVWFNSINYSQYLFCHVAPNYVVIILIFGLTISGGHFT